MKELQDRVAIVTGGARGLGEAICRSLVEAGAFVLVADVRGSLAREVAGDLEGQGGRAAALELDVGDEKQVDVAMRRVVQAHDRLDILINNAGIDVTLPIEELAVEDWDRVLRVNLSGPFLMSKYAFPYMKQQGRGHIVNVVSTAAKRAWANASAYHASKWGLLGFSHALHVEARQHNIKVTALVAGGMRTPFLLDRFPDIDVNVLQDPKNVADAVRFVLTQPEETVIPEMMVLPMRETSWP
jgi:NAD(P)-dependent dehydrogenase (short-subunit alcohol dehydrogenase family)